MPKRTNLTVKNNSTKYVLGSIFLWIIMVEIIWWNQGKTKKDIVDTGILVTQKVEIEKAKEGELCGPGNKGVVQCEEGLICDESKNINNEGELQKNAIGAGGRCKKVTPTVGIETFIDESAGFKVEYSGQRKLYKENEGDETHYIFYNYDGNIIVYVGKNWSWLNPGRTFSNVFLVDGIKSSVYEISNQKIFDIEKDDKKYSIKCVHNAKTELKKECEQFIKDFKFI